MTQRDYGQSLMADWNKASKGPDEVSTSEVHTHLSNAAETKRREKKKQQ